MASLFWVKLMALKCLTVCANSSAISPCVFECLKSWGLCSHLSALAQRLFVPSLHLGLQVIGPLVANLVSDLSKVSPDLLVSYLSLLFLPS